MPRTARAIIADCCYHVLNRSNKKARIFHAAADYQQFLGLIHMAQQRIRIPILAACLMPNHFHLVVSTPRIELSAGMHRLNCLYAMRFNKRYKRSGHLFQNRFDARLVEGDRHARAVSRYVVTNPVRAGLCRDWRHWPWSGLGAL